ncbi:hypothetical protein BKCO1_4100028 [Neofusicoccum parvum]|uniref:Uncharacterized protein n=1 Tax=Neofusicoccum parvum TaxID=310453 RepID=A0ACB5SLW3_9PEZI|nr:hypothetical protein BKCO1_4100028 [Neofusicoccum parvum]
MYEMASPPILSLPVELFDLIVGSLSMDDQMSLLTVSREFHRVMQPRVYANIVLNSKRRAGKFKRFFKKHPALAIRVTGLTVDATLQNPPRYSSRLEPPPELWKTLKVCHVLEDLESLQTLHLKMPNIDEEEHDDRFDPMAVSWREDETKLESAFARATDVFRASSERRLLPNLTSLCLYTQMLGYSRCDLPGLSIFFIPTLRKLEIANYDVGECTTWGNGGYLYLGDEHRQSTALEYLRFDNCLLNGRALSRILECPRALKTLALTHSDPHPRFDKDFTSGFWYADELTGALKTQRESLEVFEMFGGKTDDGVDWKLNGTLDLTAMECLRTVRLLRCGSRLPEGKIVLGSRARLVDFNMDF